MPFNTFANEGNVPIQLQYYHNNILANIRMLTNSGHLNFFFVF